MKAGIWLSVAFLALVAGVWWTGYNGRIQACERGIQDRVVHRDQARASFRGNTAVADDEDQPKRTREARRAQASVDLRAAVEFESRMPKRLRHTLAGRQLPEFECTTAVLGL